jgi:hypothetical protein
MFYQDEPSLFTQQILHLYRQTNDMMPAHGKTTIPGSKHHVIELGLERTRLQWVSSLMLHGQELAAQCL